MLFHKKKKGVHVCRKYLSIMTLDFMTKYISWGFVAPTSTVPGQTMLLQLYVIKNVGLAVLACCYVMFILKCLQSCQLDQTLTVGAQRFISLSTCLSIKKRGRNPATQIDHTRCLH